MADKILVVNEQEMLLLHRGLVATSILPAETVLQVADLTKKLEELEVDETPFYEALVAIVPEFRQNVAKRVLVYPDDQTIAVAVWSEEDVMQRAMELRIPITRGQAQAIVDRMDAKQDASLGITWDTPDEVAEELLQRYNVMKERAQAALKAA